MSSMKCISCGKSFFSPMGSNKCNTCTKKEGGMDNMSHEGHEGHDSCGCGHSH